MSAEQATVLALIAAGGVTADPDMTISLPGTVSADQMGELRLLVAVAVARSLAFRSAPAGTPGVFPVLLTTLGEYALRGGNPAAYQSTHAFQVLDGKVTASQVVAR